MDELPVAIPIIIHNDDNEYEIVRIISKIKQIINVVIINYDP